MTLPYPRLRTLAESLLARSTAGEVITTARAGHAGIGAHFWPQVRQWLITTGRLDASGRVVPAPVEVP